jgi:hypothetical protein
MELGSGLRRNDGFTVSGTSQNNVIPAKAGIQFCMQTRSAYFNPRQPMSRRYWAPLK